MPYQSQLSQGPDLLRQFMVTLFPGFTEQKEGFLSSRIGKVMRLPGMDVQEGLNFNQNKTSPFTPDFNGSGPFPFMFAGGNYTAPIGGGGGSGGDPHENEGGGDDGGGGGGGGRKHQDPRTPTSGGSSSSSSSSTSDSTSNSASDSGSTTSTSASGSEIASASGISGSETSGSEVIPP